MKGRVCLVTGASHGIGFATASALAAAGATVVLHGRDPERVETLCRMIQQHTGSQSVSGLAADFSSLSEVRRLAAELIARHQRLHVLVNNAGASVSGRHRTADGFEWHLGVNHLAPFLLTNLLLETLEASAPSRVVTVASVAHRGNPVDLDDLDFEQGYGSFAAYGRSKSANILFTVELARRLAGTGVTANALHPGVVATNLASTMPAPLRWIVTLLKPVMASPEQGAETSIYLATSPEVDGVTGRYFVKCREATADAPATDADRARRLWARSAELAGLDPGFGGPTTP